MSTITPLDVYHRQANINVIRIYYAVRRLIWVEHMKMDYTHYPFLGV